jgi:hypothetical protein
MRGSKVYTFCQAVAEAQDVERVSEKHVGAILMNASRVVSTALGGAMLNTALADVRSA